MAPSQNRRSFLAHAATLGLAAGVGSMNDLSTDAARRRDLFRPNPQDSDSEVFAAARRQLSFPVSTAFCNTATFGASPHEVIEAVVNEYRAIERNLPDWAYRPTRSDPGLITGYREFEAFREEAGGVMNASMDEIAFTQNATVAMSCLANGLDLEKGDEIVTSDQEHPGGISSWLLRERRHGVVVRQVKLGRTFEGGPDAVVKSFADSITPKTRVVMFSHITSTLGIKLPARELCSLARSHGALAIIDGAQAVGQIGVDVKSLGCDAYVASTHKWLLAPKGTGMLYIRREAQDRFWSTLATTGFDDRATGAFRFMRIGTGSRPALVGLIAAVRFMKRLGLERVERWDALVTNRLRAGLARLPHVKLLSPSHPQLTAAMTTFAVAGRTREQVQDELWKHQIRVREEEEGVRVSTHFYVAPADIDRLLTVVDSMR